ncbi:hypothetical protein AB0B06_32460 [Streptomyces sp. NPDC044989]|uniref:hypothetical protein n=1 Tax=Streptomyces sp. NPDC044989 TaxID=3154336 RepID=UPI0033FF33C6
MLRHRRVAGGCEDLLQRAHGTSKLWVSRWMNHDGVLDDGHTTTRPPEMPLEGERPRRLLPGRPAAVRRAAPAAAFKLEALRYAVDAERQRTAAYSRGLTALFWSNINPYGTYPLDMDKRLGLVLSVELSCPSIPVHPVPTVAEAL